jgi:hypothetical protein
MSGTFSIRIARGRSPIAVSTKAFHSSRRARHEIDVHAVERSDELLLVRRLAEIKPKSASRKVRTVGFHRSFVVVGRGHDRPARPVQTETQAAGTTEKINCEAPPPVDLGPAPRAELILGRAFRMRR